MRAVNEKNGWGVNVRVGYSGDIDTSDSADTCIGLGLACFGNCVTHSSTGDTHGGGAGYYQYESQSTAPHDGLLPSWLWVRDLDPGKPQAGADAKNLESNALKDCYALLQAGNTEDGVYFLDPAETGETTEAYCDMGNGGWTLVMKAATASAYRYSSSVWTASQPYGAEKPLRLSRDEDAVSPAFYSLRAEESKLCLGGTQFCNSWEHPTDTARNLANGPKPSSSANTFPMCYTDKCGVNTRPANIWAATSGTAAAYWSRWGYGKQSRAVARTGTHWFQ